MEKIETIEEFKYKILVEGKIGEWMFQAPKVRKLQEKANTLRLQAAGLEVEQHKKIKKAKESGDNPDTGRLWQLLQKKLDAMEDNAKEFEAEAITLAGGSEYLRKVQRITRLKGAIKVNNKKIALAEAEERKELQSKNKKYSSIIRDESKIVDAKMKEDKVKMKEDTESYLASRRAEERRNKKEVIGKGGREYPAVKR